MTKQSLWERFTPKSTAFLSSVLNNLIEQRLAPVRTCLQSAQIKRVIVEDSTALVMRKSNADQFKAHGNAHGVTAGVKVDLAYDLLSGTCVSHTIEAAAEQDKAIGNEAMDAFKPGDLILRDMGYLVLGLFREMRESGILAA